MRVTQRVPVFLGADLAHDVLPDLLGGCHALHDLQVGDLLLEHVLVGAQLQGLDHLAHLLYLVVHLDVLLPALVLLHQGYLATLLAHLQHVQRVLLLDLHHRPSELDPFVEVLEDLLFYELYLLLLIDSAAIGAHPVPAYCVFTAVATLDAR